MNLRTVQSLILAFALSVVIFAGSQSPADAQSCDPFYGCTYGPAYYPTSPWVCDPWGCYNQNTGVYIPSGPVYEPYPVYPVYGQVCDPAYMYPCG